MNDRGYYASPLALDNCIEITEEEYDNALQELRLRAEAEEAEHQPEEPTE